MELGNYGDAAHILTDLLVNTFNEAETQQRVKWQFAQSVYERFLQLLYFVDEGIWTYDATDSWVVRILNAFLLISAPISLVPKYDMSSWIRLSTGWGGIPSICDYQNITVSGNQWILRTLSPNESGIDFNVAEAGVEGREAQVRHISGIVCANLLEELHST